MTIRIILLISFIFLSKICFSKSGCCSGHKGVAGCGDNGFLLCKDGASSPTCTCGSMKVIESKKEALSLAKSDGCCSYHKGVAGCGDNGHLICNDGTSSACACKSMSNESKNELFSKSNRPYYSWVCPQGITNFSDLPQKHNDDFHLSPPNTQKEIESYFQNIKPFQQY